MALGVLSWVQQAHVAQQAGAGTLQDMIKWMRKFARRDFVYWNGRLMLFHSDFSVTDSGASRIGANRACVRWSGGKGHCASLRCAAGQGPGGVSGKSLACVSSRNSRKPRAR